MTMESLTIRKIIENVESGQIRIPAFQRGFVWEPDRVAFLMDSVYKSYPYGALLFWRTNEALKVARRRRPHATFSSSNVIRHYGLSKSDARLTRTDSRTHRQDAGIIRNVDTKTFVLLLAQHAPLSFVSGAPIDLAQKLKAYNKAESHHMMPKKFVESLGSYKDSVNCLANFCFVSRAENRHLGGDKPSIYRSKMPVNVDDILTHALCPQSLFNDAFEEFTRERATLLAKAADNLIA